MKKAILTTVSCALAVTASAALADNSKKDQIAKAADSNAKKPIQLTATEMQKFTAGARAGGGALVCNIGRVDRLNNRSSVNYFCGTY